MSKDDPQGKILVPKDRVFERGQGCWNCIHGNSANEFWTDKRKVDLLAIKTLLAEEFPSRRLVNEQELIAAAAASKSRVTARRLKMIDTIDHSVAAHALLRCTKGITAEGKPVGDLVAHNYLCSRWSGKQGASVAREGGKLDDLPEELADKLDGGGLDLDRLIDKKLIEN